MKILILCHESLVPKLGWAAWPEWRVEKSRSRTEVFCAQTLKRLGHRVYFSGVGNKFGPAKSKIKKIRPEIVFNFLEEFDGEGLLEPLVVDLIESVGGKSTGCGGRGLLLAKNKVACNELLRARQIRVPAPIGWPRIVKFVGEDASLGISDSNIVFNSTQETRALNRMQKLMPGAVYSEKFIEGRELFCSVFVDDRRDVLISDLFEIDFGCKKGPKIMTERMKWDFKYRKSKSISFGRAVGLPKTAISECAKFVKTAISELCLNGPVRFDFRMTKGGRLFLIEVNPNPDLAKHDEYVAAMKSLGLTYEDVLTMIIRRRVSPKSIASKTPSR